MASFCSGSLDDGPPRPEAITAIGDRPQAGIRVKMITGDHPQTAMKVIGDAGIGNAGERYYRARAGGDGR